MCQKKVVMMCSGADVVRAREKEPDKQRRTEVVPVKEAGRTSEQPHALLVLLANWTLPSGLIAAYWKEKKRPHLLIQETRPHSLSTDCSWARNRAEGAVKFHVKGLDTEDPPWLSQVYIYDAHDWLLCLKKTYGFKWIQLGVSTLENMGSSRKGTFTFVIVQRHSSYKMGK